MKKIFLFILLLVLSLSNIVGVIAEEFTLHAGTTFNDTIEMVKEKENTAKKVEFVKEYIDGDKTILLYNGTITGFNDVQLKFIFSNDGTLSNVLYTYNSSIAIDAYKDLLTLLSQKYGSPLDEMNSMNREIYGYYLSDYIPKFNDALHSHGVFGQGYTSDDIKSYKSWLILNDSNNVKIEIFLMLHNKNTTLRYYTCQIEYYCIPSEVLDMVEEKQVSIWDDI